MKNILDEKVVLVTGGSGFVGSHIILKLLQKGYQVRTTMRSLNRKGEVMEMLKRGGLNSFEKLSFIQTDLNSDQNWDKAMENCEYVLHVASPLPSAEPENDWEVIDPARDGALRVLKSARDSDVKRVVLTSSFAAIGYTIDSANHVFTEEDWTDPTKPNPAYIRSKAIAEKAAWDFVKNEAQGLELSVINPVGIFGPALGKDYSISIQLIKNIMEGDTMEMFDYAFGVIDVRDVADLHIEAMTNPRAKGQRFLATADGPMTCFEIGELIKRERGNHANKIGSIKPVNSIKRLELSNAKAKNLLNWTPISREEAILATVDSLIE